MTRGMAYRGVPANAVLKYRRRHLLRLQVMQGTEVVSCCILLLQTCAQDGLDTVHGAGGVFLTKL